MEPASGKHVFKVTVEPSLIWSVMGPSPNRADDADTAVVLDPPGAKGVANWQEEELSDEHWPDPFPAVVSTPQLLLAEYKFSDTRTTPDCQLKAKASFGFASPVLLVDEQPARTTHAAPARTSVRRMIMTQR